MQGSWTKRCEAKWLRSSQLQRAWVQGHTAAGRHGKWPHSCRQRLQVATAAANRAGSQTAAADRAGGHTTAGRQGRWPHGFRQTGVHKDATLDTSPPKHHIPQLHT